MSKEELNPKALKDNSIISSLSESKNPKKNTFELGIKNCTYTANK